MTDSEHLKHGRDVILQEAEAVRALAERMGENFSEAVELIIGCQGRIILTGIGKSGHIARKLAATFTSTGAPAFFLHPSEGAHGDLGLLQKGDLLIALSKSGSTVELEMIFPSVNRLGLKSILLTGQSRSALADKVDVTLDCAVAAEACPHNLAPTTSSTAAMAMGHALVVAALKARNFSSEQFADLHPAGALGQRLQLCVRDRMHTGEALPLVSPQSLVRDTIFEITGKRFGCALVCDNQRRLLGIFTDGDLRRLTVREDNFLNLHTESGMTLTPRSIGPDALLDEALSLMEQHSITVLPVVENNLICGILHMHDILSPERPARSAESTKARQGGQGE